MARNFFRPAPASRRLSIEQLEPRDLLAATDLRITEFLASNDDGLLDVDGAASDWLEIYNSGSTSVDLSGMYLTDNGNNKTKWAFPAGTTLAAGGYRIVFASNKNGTLAGGELHTNFALSANGEYLGLIASDGVTVIDHYTPSFPTQVEDVSYGRAMQATASPTTIIANGAIARAWVPTSNIYDATWRTTAFNSGLFNIVGPTGFGYENNPGDAINFTAEIGTTVPSSTRSLYMRMPFNLATLAGVDKLTLRMRYDDGFVAYINGQLVAEAGAPETVQWNSTAAGTHDDGLAEQFIDFDVSSVISKLLVGQNVLAIHGLNVAGSDMLIAPELIAQAKTLVAPDRLGYFDLPTPGYGNGDNYLGFATQPTVSVPHGFYSTAQSVALATSLPGAIIVYTTNGSTPTVNASLVPTNGTLYTTPISISATTNLRAVAFKAEYKPSFVTTASYVFLNDVLNQSPTGTPPAGWPANGAVNGQAINYGIDPDVIAQYGAQAVKEALGSLPSFSLTTDLANLFNVQTGIYVNALFDGRDWERPASAELINSDGSGFTINAGLRIRGGYSRNDFSPKRSFRLYFRSEYGASKLEYPLFGAEGPDEYDVIDLRTEQNHSWSSRGSTETTFLREVFARDLQGDMGEEYTRSRYYHLYLNGQYWGVYMTQERVQEDFGVSHFGGEPEDYDILKAGRSDGGGTQLAEGNEDAWTQLFTSAQNLATNYAQYSNNYWTMQGVNPDGTRNPSLPVLLDVDNLVNFMMVIFYTGGFDTGISRFFGENEANNWYGLYNRVAADQGFQFFVHDNEHSLGNEEGGTVHGTQYIDRTGPFNAGNQNNYDYFNPAYLHQDLLAVPDYRQRFVDKAQQYFFNGGLMTPAASIARMHERRLQVDPAIIAESARWGDSVRTNDPFDKLDWQTEVNWLYQFYFPTRTSTVVEQLRADGLYVTAPSFSLPAGNVLAGAMLTISAPNSAPGTIYYTIDGISDPRLPNGGFNNGAGQIRAYASPIAINADQTIKARYRTTAGDWSSLKTITYNAKFSGDYDGNDRVDGDDVLVWQRQLGNSSVPTGSGADGMPDGTIDAADLDVWRNAYGVGGQVVVAASTAEVAAAAMAETVEGALFSLPGSAFFGGSLENAPASSSSADDASKSAAEIADAAFGENSPWLPGAGADAPVLRRPSFRPASRMAVGDDDAGADEDFAAATLDAALAEVL